MTVLPGLEQLLGDAAERLTPAVAVAGAGGGVSASDRRAAGWSLGRPSRRWRPLALVVLLVLGGATAALAAAGVFRTGTPVGANVPANPRVQDGLAIGSSVRLLPLSVSDPGGGPAWGLRYMRTTRGLACLQYGRVLDGKIGALGEDGAFSNDGRFHSFSVNYEQGGLGSGCSDLDTRGGAVFNSIVQRIPAGALDGSCYPTKPSPPPGALSPPRLEICPAGDLRDLYFGLLGPDAVSISYKTAAGQAVTERTAGPNGAYLIVGSPTPQACWSVEFRGRVYHPCGNGGTSSASLQSYGVIRSVTYRDGRTCRPATEPSGCPPVGYTTAPARQFTSSEVRAPISVSTSLGWRYCTNGNTTQPCRGKPPAGYHLTPAAAVTAYGRTANAPPGGFPQIQVAVTFSSRVAITNIDSAYSFYWQLTPANTHACQVGALAGRYLTREDLRAGQRVTEQIFVDQACPGTIHGSITLNTAKGPATDLGLIGPQGNAIPVGNFTLRVP